MRKNKDKAEIWQAEEPARLHDGPARQRPAGRFREHTRLMCDIIAIAFQTDKTRVATLLLARDLSALYYPFLEVREGTMPRRTITTPTGTNGLRVPPEPVRLSGEQARQHARRQRHGAR